MMPWFASRSGSPERNPRVRMLAADARRFVRAAPPGYDVVIADVFHPARDGAAGLYAREHFAAIRRILREGGLFCQWLPLHQLDAGTLRVIVRTFLDVFPETSAFLLHFSVDVPVLGLVGSEGALTVPPDALEGRPGRGEVEARSRDAGLPGTIHLLGTFVAGRRALGSFAGGAPANTDDRPIVAALATAHLRRRGIPPYESLFDLLASVRPAAGPELEALVAGGVASGGRDAADRSAPGDGTASGDGTAAGEAGARGAAFRAHLAAYVAARDRYLRGLVEEGTGRLGPAVDAYLDAVRTSLYFTPAYARLVTIVQAMAAGDIAGAREVFRRLEEARPDQPLGRRILGPLLEG